MLYIFVLFLCNPLLTGVLLYDLFHSRVQDAAELLCCTNALHNNKKPRNTISCQGF